uniref:MFS transporter n=1 Tax=Desertifilum tharense IPPAS B-1220 TaxID=1781255 RepID=A0ACD5GTL8_9CYAN
MIAPLIPRLATIFQVAEQEVGLIVPAYLMVLRPSRPILRFAIGCLRSLARHSAVSNYFCPLHVLTATAQDAFQMTLWRLLTGLGASGVIPLTFALIGDLFPFRERGKLLGFVFACMEGEWYFGSAGGALLEPFVRWQSLFIGTAVAMAIILWRLSRYATLFDTPERVELPTISSIFAGYRSVLASFRGQRTYAYVFFNGVFHSGVYTWLGLYLTRRYELSDIGIGFAIFGYGVPGLLFSPLIGRLADRWGRRWLIPPGLAISAAPAAVMIFQIPLWMTTACILVLSLGYDLTQPLFAGIVTNLGEKIVWGKRWG